MSAYTFENTGIEVKGDAVLGFVHSMKMGTEIRSEILRKHGIEARTQQWYNMQHRLNAYEEIAREFGDMNLFLIGKSIANSAASTTGASLWEALESINVSFHLNHRKNGEVMYNAKTGEMLEGIGHYRLTEYSTETRTAVMVCNTPYPSKFDEGLITQIVRNFKPEDSIFQEVKLDATQPSRINGAHSCTYLIQW